MPTINVSNATQFTAALKTVKGGDTILMAAGNYGNLFISNFNPTSLVTIKSANPDADAVIHQLRITRSSNVLLTDVDVVNDLTGFTGTVRPQAVQINGSSNITLHGMDISGSLDGNAWNDGQGVSVVASRRISLLDNHFLQTDAAIVASKTSDLVVAGNSIRDVQEGLVMSQVNSALIERNVMTQFNPNLATGMHPDFIQVHSGGTGTLASSDLLIRNNVLVEGASNGPIQGVFIRSEAVAAGQRHSNITVANNYYEGSSRHGITVADTDGVKVVGNTVLEGANKALAPAITVSNSTAGLVDRNVTTLLLLGKNNNGVSYGTNVDVQDSQRLGGHLRSSLFSHAEGSLDFGAFAPLAGTPAGRFAAGFRAPDADIGHLTGSALMLHNSYGGLMDGAQFTAQP